MAVRPLLSQSLAGRVAPLEALTAQVPALVRTASAMAERFAAGGRLLVLGSPTDAQHVAVEFLHPVIVGKPALPALSLVADIATLQALGPDAFSRQLDVLARPEDIALGITQDLASPDVDAALALAGSRGLLTVHLGGRRGDLQVPSDDPLVVKEGHVSAYHLLWELVHVFLEDRRGVADEDPALALYPFLGGGTGSARTTGSAEQSCIDKLHDVMALRTAVCTAESERIAACGEQMAARLAAGGTLLAFGNGGSSTDTQDVVQTFLAPPRGRPLPALGLTNDVAVLTALTNDVSFEVVFARQLAALARPGDIALGISTSGGSANVLQGLASAADRGLLTVGLAGNEGGAMRDLARLDHLFVVPSSSVHRVQEVQTTLYHLLWEAVQGSFAL